MLSSAVQNPSGRRFVHDCDIKPETSSMLKLKAVARQIHARHQTLSPVAIREGVTACEA
jgi:hypothetical protein